MSRNQYLLKIVEEHLNECGSNDNELKNLQGPRIESPAQAEPETAPTSTNTEPASKADNVIGMTTDGGRIRRGGADTNEK